MLNLQRIIRGDNDNDTLTSTGDSSTDIAKEKEKKESNKTPETGLNDQSTVFIGILVIGLLSIMIFRKRKSIN